MHYFTVGKYRLAAGLSWSVLTGGRPGRQLRALTGRRNPCVLVRQGEMQYAGVGEGRERAWSIAVAALPALGQNGYALIKLPDERWLFLAAVDGMPALQGDITGDSVTCIRARDRFLAFHDAPVSGWQETGTEAAPADITALLPPRLPAAARLFIPGQRVRRCLLVGLAAVAIWYAWDYWQGVQRREAQRLAAQARKQAPKKTGMRRVALPHPWATLSTPQHLLGECLTAVRNLPLTLSGWTLKGGECRGDGIRAEYHFQAGSTLTRFRESALALTPPPVVMTSDDGQSGEIRWPIPAGEMTDERPGNQTEQLTPFISSLQARNVTLQLKADPPLRRPSQTIDGEVIRYIQGWQSWSFSVTSPRAPDRWFPLQKGIRITDIAFSLSAATSITWKTSGQIFAIKEPPHEDEK
ncbi:type 4b pilus protein PilO2 [Klebsiella oxytoca]|uniref:type 4b pilus protein PilO2 n=1 Tax=Klebsiella oxytoca TaxID=571 RepID=UPI002931E571|nr:type 4b pilus protein PilO2 [Klebsiella oxytoca]